MPDAKWGERPLALVVAKPGAAREARPRRSCTTTSTTAPTGASLNRQVVCRGREVRRRHRQDERRQGEQGRPPAEARRRRVGSGGRRGSPTRLPRAQSCNPRTAIRPPSRAEEQHDRPAADVRRPPRARRRARAARGARGASRGARPRPPRRGPRRGRSRGGEARPGARGEQVAPRPADGVASGLRSPVEAEAVGRGPRERVGVAACEGLEEGARGALRVLALRQRAAGTASGWPSGLGRGRRGPLRRRAACRAAAHGASGPSGPRRAPERRSDPARPSAPGEGPVPPPARQGRGPLLRRGSRGGPDLGGGSSGPTAAGPVRRGSRALRPCGRRRRGILRERERRHERETVHRRRSLC